MPKNAFLDYKAGFLGYMRQKLLIILIFLSALFLRVYKLGNYPVGFLWDEAALGYNAFSILKTGKDEYGKLFPLIFKSFGDYKPGLYVYLTVPVIAAFGLNEFAVRLSSAFSGALAILTFYLLVRECEKKVAKNGKIDNLLPLLSALLLTVSPWHLVFSRGAWEVNVMLAEILLAFFLLLRFLNSQKRWQLFLGAGVMLLTLLTYQAAKLLMPVLVSALVFFFRKEITFISKKDKLCFFGIILFGWLIFNLITVTLGQAGRLKVMSIFSYPRSEVETGMIKNQDENNRFDFSLFHSSPVFFTRSVLGHYFNHFSGKFLFIDGDWSNPRNGVVYQGLLYYLDALFLVAGFMLVLGKKREPLINFMLFWLFAAPVASALTRDSVSAVRSFTMVIPLIYISATGLAGVKNLLEGRNAVLRIVFFLALGFFYLFLVIRFLDLYFLHDPHFSSKDRLYGYKEMVNFIEPLGKGKKHVEISNNYGQPYIFYLFYTGYDPINYQKVAFLKENAYGDVGEVEKLDNIEFKKIFWPDDRGITNSLFVGDEFDLPLRDIVGQENIYFFKEIKFLDGKTAFRIVEAK